MKAYSVYLSTETEKYDLIRAIRAAGCRLTAGQLATWQERHGLRFTPAGEVLPA